MSGCRGATKYHIGCKQNSAGFFFLLFKFLNNEFLHFLIESLIDFRQKRACIVKSGQRSKLQMFCSNPKVRIESNYRFKFVNDRIRMFKFENDRNWIFTDQGTPASAKNAPKLQGKRTKAEIKSFSNRSLRVLGTISFMCRMTTTLTPEAICRIGSRWQAAENKQQIRSMLHNMVIKAKLQPIVLGRRSRGQSGRVSFG